MQIDDVTQNFLYGSFQVEHSSGFVTSGDFIRSLVKYFELGHESCVRVYGGSDLSDEIYRCTSVYILGIHDVCCRYCRTATRSGLAVDENAPTLIELSLYECYRGDQMLKHVSFLYIVQGDLVSGEGLRDGESPPHRGQDTVNVVRSESIDIFSAVEVSDP